MEPIVAQRVILGVIASAGLLGIFALWKTPNPSVDKTFDEPTEDNATTDRNYRGSPVKCISKWLTVVVSVLYTSVPCAHFILNDADSTYSSFSEALFSTLLFSFIFNGIAFKNLKTNNLRPRHFILIAAGATLLTAGATLVIMYLEWRWS